MARHLTNIRVVTVSPADKALAEEGMSSITKEMTWSQASYTPNLLAKKFHDKLPIFVKVSKGYYGENSIDTVTQDEIIRVHQLEAQPRILVRDRKSRLLSIPTDWPILVRAFIKKDKKSKEKRLADVVEEFHLPVRVVFDKSNKWKFKIGNQAYTNKTFGEMDVVGYYTERYLKGNAIHNGVLHTKILLLPVYLNAHLTVAESVKAGTAEDWDDLVQMYNTVATTIDFGERTGTKDILIYNIDRYQLNNELSEFFRIVKTGKPTVVERSEDETPKMLPNMTMTLSISGDTLRQQQSAEQEQVRTEAAAATTTTTTTTTTQDVVTSTEISSSSRDVTVSTEDTTVHKKQEKSDSGKASDDSSSISSAGNLQATEQTQTAQVRSIVNVELKANTAEEESTTVKSSDSGVYVSKGIQADDLPYRQEDPRGIKVLPEYGHGPPAPFVYVPIRDPGYDAYKSWRVRNDAYQRKPIPMAFASSQGTMYVGDDDAWDEPPYGDYPTLRSRGGGRYGMMMSGYGSIGRAAGPRRPQLAGSATDLTRRELQQRMYTDFDDPPMYDGYSISRRPAYHDIDELDAPGYATTRVYVDGNYGDGQRDVRQDSRGADRGQYIHGDGMYGSSGQVYKEQYVHGGTMYGSSAHLGTMNGSSAQGGTMYGSNAPQGYKDIYDRGGLHIGLVGTDRRPIADDGGYTSKGVMVDENQNVISHDRELVYSGSLTLPQTPNHRQQENQKIRRRLSSSHKYAARLNGDGGHAYDMQDIIDGSNFEYVPTDTRRSRLDHYQSADNIQISSHNNVKRSSSFVHVTTGQVSRGPSTLNRNATIAVDGRKSQHRSASIEVLDRIDDNEANSEKKSNVQRNIMSQYSNEQQQLEQTQLKQQQQQQIRQQQKLQQQQLLQQQHLQEQQQIKQQQQLQQQQLLQQQQHLQQQELQQQNQQRHKKAQQQQQVTNKQSGVQSSQEKRSEKFRSSIKVAVNANASNNHDTLAQTSSGHYDVQRIHQSGSGPAHGSSMPMSEMQSDSESESDTSVMEEVVGVIKVQRKDGVDIAASGTPTTMASLSVPAQHHTEDGSDVSVVEEEVGVVKVQRKDGVDIAASGTPTAMASLSVPAQHRTEDGSDVSVVEEEVGVVKVQRKDGVDITANGTAVGMSSLSPPARLANGDASDASSAQTHMAVTKQQTIIGGQAAKSQMSFDEELRKRIQASKAASKGGINNQMITSSIVTSGQAMDNNANQNRSSVTSLRQAYSVHKATTEFNSVVTSHSSEQTRVETRKKSEGAASTGKVEMRKKSEGAASMDNEVRESIRNLDDFLKTQMSDNASLDSQTSAKLMNDNFSFGAANIETWHL